jgi:hypothetical protein
MKLRLFILIALILSCSYKKVNEDLNGIDLEIFMKEIGIEKAIGLASIENTSGDYNMRICKMETMGSDTNAIDFLIDIKFTHQSAFINRPAPIVFSIWELKHNKVLISKNILLENDDQMKFMFVLDSLKPQFQKSLDCENTFDGSEHFVLRFYYQYFNQYYFNNNCDNSASNQGRFISYLTRLVKNKTNIDF